MSQYESFKKYEVKAANVAEFLDKYTKKARHRDQPEDYKVYRIESHQKMLDEDGFIFVSRHDSVTGEIVAYYGNDVPKLQVVTRICTTHDTNGNARRMAIVDEIDPQTGEFESVAYIKEGYLGDRAFAKCGYPDAKLLRSIHVQPGEYRDFIKTAKEAGKLIEN